MRWKWRMRWHRNQPAYWVYSRSSVLMVESWVRSGHWGWRYRKPISPKGKARVGGFPSLRTSRRVWDV